MTPKNKDFFEKLSAIYDIQNEYKNTQDFYQDRIDKIKNDSSCHFNQYTINSVIQQYV